MAQAAAGQVHWIDRAAARGAREAAYSVTTTAKRLDQMDDLWDMGRFPTSIYVGATGNILGTIALTYRLHHRFPQTPALLIWALTIIPLNLLPVALLRRGMDATTEFPQIERMRFRTDQHKFATWVYAVASANMLFWIVLAWCAFSYRRTPAMLAAVLLLAFGCTFFPAWRRLFVAAA